MSTEPTKILLKTRHDYQEWSGNVRKDLKSSGVWELVDPRYSPPVNRNRSAKVDFKDRDDIAKKIILKHISDAEKVEKLSHTSRDLWLSLKAQFSCLICEQLGAATNNSVEALARSALHCLHCELLLRSAELLCPGWTLARRLLRFVDVTEVAYSRHGQPYAQARLSGDGASGDVRRNIEIRIDCDGDSVWQPDQSGSLSEEDWMKPGRLLQECLDNHKVCRIPNVDFVPKRLVELRHEGTEYRFRLVERHGYALTSGVLYCALSYCWGAEMHSLCTTRENLEMHLKEIPFSTIPQTIQDACIMCLSLQIQYLWVDALCIVQNDTDARDWTEQSGEMCEVYSNAHIVISADASPSGNAGFLPGRDHSDTPWRNIWLSDHESQRPLRAAVRLHRLYKHVSCNGKSWHGDSPTPLQRRGWALQEGLLANRLLHFTAYGITYECNHRQQNHISLMSRAIRLAKLSHIYPDVKCNWPRSELKDLYAEQGEESSRHITDFLIEDNSATIYLAWQGIVSSYSQRSLTKIMDKLSALSGLARLVSEALNAKPDSYLAGHWLDDIASSLLWYVTLPNFPNRSTPYRAPTWSWASVDGQVSYFQEQYQFMFTQLITVRLARCNRSMLDSFGRVFSGEMLVTGLLVPVNLVVSASRDHPTTYHGNAGCPRKPYASQYSWVQARMTQEEQSLESSDFFRHYEVILDDEVEAQPLLPTNYACLLTGKHMDLKTGGCRMWWLVLRQTLRNDKCWERIGIGYFQEYNEMLWLFAMQEAKRMTIKLV